MSRPPAFDRDVGLAEILASVPRAGLDAALDAAIGPAWTLSDEQGQVLRQGSIALPSATTAHVLEVDLRAVGTLTLPAESGAQGRACARWIELLLAASNRYRMAADLHLQAVHADYADLQQSEARYRTLSEQLEQRVREQVAQIEQGQRRLYQAEKLASIGSLAAGMAHEINNPIGFIRSNLSTAREYVKTLARALDNPPQKLADILEDFASLLDESSTGADRVARIVDDMKSYASSTAEARLGIGDPGEAWRAAVRLLGELPPEVQLHAEWQPLPLCLCDPEGMRKAALALLLNAREAMRGRRGTIRVSSRVQDDALLFTVQDEGCGIDPAIAGRIFDPFFTTREVGAGMGLGLTVANDIVRAHDGEILVDSTPGSGSRFTIRLPQRVTEDAR